MKRIESLLYGVLFLGVGFAGGWIAARHGPAVVDAPLDAVLECALEHRHATAVPSVRVTPPPRVQAPPPATPEDYLRADAERRGLEVSHWNTQLDELSGRIKERSVRLNMLMARADPADAGTVAALKDELALIEVAMDDVRVRKAEALDDLSRLDLVLDAEAAIAAARLDG